MLYPHYTQSRIESDLSGNASPITWIYSAYGHRRLLQRSSSFHLAYHGHASWQRAVRYVPVTKASTWLNSHRDPKWPLDSRRIDSREGAHVASLDRSLNICSSNAVIMFYGEHQLTSKHPEQQSRPTGTGASSNAVTLLSSIS
jgi:hypothetical protein